MNKQLRLDVLSKIKPTPQEHKDFSREVKLFLSKLREGAKILGISADFFVGGSFGKGTYLRGNFDVDVFCNFDENYSESKLSKFAQQILILKKIQFKKQKGSRDYFSGTFGEKVKFEFEIVPNKKWANPLDAINSTDLSPLHVEYLKEEKKKNSKLTDEIRLAKQFFKSKELYGAESYIQGFSGHCLDILIMYYKSLENLLQEAKNWDKQTIIDVNNNYSSPKKVLKNIEKDKHSNLIIVDPVIIKRNAARALGSENYAKFIYLASTLKELTIEDFSTKTLTSKEFNKKMKTEAKKLGLTSVIYEVSFSLDKLSEDIVGAKLLKIFKNIEKYFKDYDFNTFSSQFHINMKEQKVLYVYFFEHTTLSLHKKVRGPQVYLKEAVKGFREKREKVFVEGEHVYTYEKREYTTLNNVSKITLKKAKSFLNSSTQFISSFTKL